MARWNEMDSVGNIKHGRSLHIETWLCHATVLPKCASILCICNSHTIVEMIREFWFAIGGSIHIWMLAWRCFSVFFFRWIQSETKSLWRFAGLRVTCDSFLSISLRLCVCVCVSFLLMFNFPFDICINIQFSMACLERTQQPKTDRKRERNIFTLFTNRQKLSSSNVIQCTPKCCTSTKYLKMALKRREIAFNYKVTQH